jgi:CubicO group peptidase (beta-lactamase class C family)
LSEKVEVQTENIMKIYRSIFPLVSIYLLLIFPTIVLAQNSKAREIDTFLKPLIAKKQFSGVIFATKNGKKVYEKAFGMANAELNVPNQVNTRFSIASVTKSFTRIIAIRLLEAQKLGLQDKLSKFIPDFPNGDQITVEMLMRHRSGIPHRVTKPEEEAISYLPAEMVEKAKLAKLVFAPGTQRLYSSAGYSVFTRVLEIASGKTYPQLLEEYIFTPAAMKDSLDFNGEKILERRAQEYLLEADGIVHAPLKDYSFLVGAGSVFGTAQDIYQFGNALLDGKFGENSKQSLQDDEGVFNDNGNTNGYRCYFTIDRKKGYEFVLITNLESGANDVIVRDLQAILENKKVLPPVIPNPIITNDANKDLNDFTGSYWLDTANFEITVSKNLLFAGRFKLFPIGKDKFYNFAGYAEITFKRGEDGKVKELIWSAPGNDSTWFRK